jgi:histidinol-phosphatase (PHP family)
MVLKWDGHTHTNFCRHGSSADMTLYVEQAIRLGFQRYTLSEHPPLPEAWVSDPVLMKELAMRMDELPDYMNQAVKTKERYQEKIEVTVGLELDYLHGEPEFALRMVDRWEKRLEDVVVSVHFLPGAGGMRCIDYTPQDFADGLLSYYGSMEAVIEEYYNHIESAIEWAKQLPMRKRLGHINLIEKFRLALPETDPLQIDKRLKAILPKLQAAGVGIDVNTAGFRKQTCGKPYVPEWFMHQCMELGIPLVFGSDAHDPQDVGAGWEWFEKTVSAHE